MPKPITPTGGFSRGKADFDIFAIARFLCSSGRTRSGVSLESPTYL